MKNMNIVWFLFNVISVFSSSITNPFGENGDIDKILPEYFDSRIFNNNTKAYHRSIPDVLDNVIPIHEDPICEVGFRFRWSATLGSSAYSSPVIFPSGPQGKRQIFQNTFYQYIEMIGHDGYKPWGWPLSFEESSFQGSPILYDIDGDGTNDLGAFDKNGNMYWIRIGEYGRYLEDYHIKIPKLKIKKNWYKDLDPNVMDTYTINSMFDRETNHYDMYGNEEKNNIEKNSKAKRDDLLIVNIHQDNLAIIHKSKEKDDVDTSNKKNNDKNVKEENSLYKDRRRRLLSTDTTTITTTAADAIDPESTDKAEANIDQERTAVEVEVESEADTADAGDGEVGTTNSMEEDAQLEQDILELNEPPPPHNIIITNEDAAAEAIDAVVEGGGGGGGGEGVIGDADKKISTEAIPVTNKIQDNQENEKGIQTDSQDVPAAAVGDGSNVDVGDVEKKDNIEADVESESYYGVGHMDDYMSMIQQQRQNDRHRDGSAPTIHNDHNDHNGDNRVGIEGGGEGGGESRDSDTNVDTTSGGPTDSLSSEQGDGSNARGEGSSDSPGDFPSDSHNYAGMDAADPYHSFDDGGYRYYGRFHGMYNDSDYVFTDAHVLSTPVLVDVDGDGKAEVIVAISYYFDKTEYVGRKDLDFEPDMYIAGGLGCWDLVDQTWIWLIHLDLTTDKTKFKALIYGTPTVADLDGDGRYEVIIGTSLGLLYIMDADTGFVKRHFPIQFHEIQCQIAVADIWGGHNLEVIVADMGGNLVVINSDGDVLWDRKLSGTLPHTPSIGDIDGDGQLDVVIVAVGETGSHIWALRGDTGKILSGYPIALPLSSVATSSILLADLHTYPSPDRTNRNNNNPAATSAVGASEQDNGDNDDNDDMNPEHIIEAIGGISNSNSNSNKNRKINKRRTNDPYLPKWTYNTEGHSNSIITTATTTTTITASSSIVEKSATATTTTVKNSKNNNNSTTGTTNKGLHLILASFDGHVYIIDGITKCTERIDVGEHIYSMPLLDDITGDGYLDLVIGTMNGQVIVMESSIPYHPLSVWTSFPRGRLNGFTYGQTGISVSLAERNRLKRSDMLADKLSISTKLMTLQFDIWDTRAPPVEYSEGSRETRRTVEEMSSQRRYTVTFSKGTNKAHSLLTVEYTTPGSYTVQLPINPPEEMLLVVGMTTDRGLYYEDILPVAIGTKFYVWIKYFVAAPIAILCLPLLLYTRRTKLS